MRDPGGLELLEAVREIAEGGAVRSPEVAMRVAELFRKTRTAEQSLEGLSPQELRLLKLVRIPFSSTPRPN